MMPAAEDTAFVRARGASLKAYERGRWLKAGLHALLFWLFAALLSVAFVGPSSLIWSPLALVAWALVEWRGMELLRGGRVGALAGALTLVLPMSVLRRCCKPGALEMMGADCCSMPGACAAAGVIVGLVLACFLPTQGRRRDMILGMMLGMAAIAPMKCSTLLVGEAFGLLGGLVAGALATSAVRVFVGRQIVRG